MSVGGRAAGLGLLLLALAGTAVSAWRSEWARLAWEPAAAAESDFELHWAAGRALAQGKDPYDRAAVNAVGASTGRAFTPFCAANPLVVRLFGLASDAGFADAYRWWRDVNVAMYLAAAVLLGLALRRAGRVPLAAALALAVAALGLDDGTWQALFYNQTNGVTLLAVCGALLAAQRGRPVTEGVLLALATLAKTSPALLLVAALLAGRRRTVVAGLLALVASGALSLAWNGAAVHASYLDMTRTHLAYAAQPGPGEFNNSLHDWNLAPNGQLSRAVDAVGWPAAWARAGAWSVTLLVLALLARAVRRGVAPRAVRDEPDALLALYALGLSAGFLTSSVTWAPHLSLAALPAAWLVLSGGPRAGGGAVAAATAAVVAVLYVPLGTFAEDLHQVLDVRLKTAALVGLYALVLSRATRTTRAASATAPQRT